MKTQLTQTEILKAKKIRAEKLLKELVEIKNPLTHARTERYYYVLRIYQSYFSNQKTETVKMESALREIGFFVGDLTDKGIEYYYNKLIKPNQNN